MSDNLFELSKNWPVPPANNTVTATDHKLQVKIESQDPDQQNPSETTPKPEQCKWEQNCPICKNAEEDWDGEHQNNFSNLTKMLKQIQSRNFPSRPKIQDKPRHKTISAPKITNPQNSQPSQTHSFDVSDHCVEQI